MVSCSLCKIRFSEVQVREEGALLGNNKRSPHCHSAHVQPTGAAGRRVTLAVHLFKVLNDGEVVVFEGKAGHP